MKSVQGIKSELTVAIDIETVRVGEKFEDLSEGFQSAWEYKNKQDGVIPDIEELSAMWEKNSSLYAEFSKVCAVSLTFLHQDKLYCKEFYGTNEKELLKSLGVTLENMLNSNSSYRLVGHASTFFDYPFLSKRFLINGLPIPNILDTSALKPWESKNLCTNTLWKVGGTGAGSSLQALCNVLDIPSSKVDIIGDEVGQSYFRGELERIGRYCSLDSIATFNVFRKFKYEPIFNYEDVEYLKGYVDGDKTEEVNQTLLQELYNTKNFSTEFQERLRKQLKERKMLKKEIKTVEKLLLSHYLDKIDVMSFDKKETEASNKERTLEIKNFIKTL